VWNEAEARPEAKSRSKTMAKCGASPIDEIEMAAAAGANTTNHRLLVRSASTPMNGCKTLGSCWAGTISAAMESGIPSFS
jgi:hypothetical protein